MQGGLKGKRMGIFGLALTKFLSHTPFRGKEMAILEATPSCAAYISS